MYSCGRWLWREDSDDPDDPDYQKCLNGPDEPDDYYDPDDHYDPDESFHVECTYIVKKVILW